MAAKSLDARAKEEKGTKKRKYVQHAVGDRVADHRQVEEGVEAIGFFVSEDAVVVIVSAAERGVQGENASGSAGQRSLHREWERAAYVDMETYMIVRSILGQRLHGVVVRIGEEHLTLQRVERHTEIWGMKRNTRQRAEERKESTNCEKKQR